jgi:hypothetical protein
LLNNNNNCWLSLEIIIELIGIREYYFNRRSHDALYGQPKSENSKIISVCSGDAIIMSCFDLQPNFEWEKKRTPPEEQLEVILFHYLLRELFVTPLGTAKGYNPANTCYIYVPGQRSLSLDLC